MKRLLLLLTAVSLIGGAAWVQDKSAEQRKLETLRKQQAEIEKQIAQIEGSQKKVDEKAMAEAEKAMAEAREHMKKAREAMERARKLRGDNIPFDMKLWQMDPELYSQFKLGDKFKGFQFDPGSKEWKLFDGSEFQFYTPDNWKEHMKLWELSPDTMKKFHGYRYEVTPDGKKFFKYDPDTKQWIESPIPDNIKIFSPESLKEGLLLERGALGKALEGYRILGPKLQFDSILLQKHIDQLLKKELEIKPFEKEKPKSEGATLIDHLKARVPSSFDELGI